MNWVWLFFGFSGRIGRAKYWLASITMTVAAFAVYAGLYGLGLITDVSTSRETAIFLAPAIPVFLSSLAISGKRLHDRNKSAVWLIVFFGVPTVLEAISEAVGGRRPIEYILSAIGIWMLIELGFLRGTNGSNRYGPDPLQSME